VYECETWSLKLREKCRVRVFKYRVLRRTFGPKGYKVTVKCGEDLHNEEINPLNAKLNTICHLPALLEAHHILHVSSIRVNDLYSSP
jgi:hypothetical protein